MTRAFIAALAVGIAAGFAGALRRERALARRVDALRGVAPPPEVWVGVDVGADGQFAMVATHVGPDGVVRLIDEVHVHGPDTFARRLPRTGA